MEDLDAEGPGTFPVYPKSCDISCHTSVEMQPWIRSWGAQVEVLAPDWLRERIAAELRQAAELYSGKKAEG